jgi:hypothetical protein
MKVQVTRIMTPEMLEPEYDVELFGSEDDDSTKFYCENESIAQMFKKDLEWLLSRYDKVDDVIIGRK